VVAFTAAAPGPAGAFSSVRRRYRFGVTVATRGRRVAVLHVGGREHVLLVAPTAEGGFCTSLSGSYGGTGCPLTAVVRGDKGVLAPDIAGDAGGPILFNGYLTFANGVRLEVTYQDGERATIPFVWVTSPIRAGFFIYDLTGHRRAGHRPELVTLFDAAGRRLAERQLPQYG
jgi:hypothetical protein